MRVCSISAMWIALKSYRSSRSTPFVPLAHVYLTSPLPLVHLMFDVADAPRTWKASEVGLFNVESEQDRLNVGSVKLGCEGLIFGVAREAQTFRQVVPRLTDTPDSPNSAESFDQCGLETAEAKEGPDVTSIVQDARGKPCLSVISGLSVAVITLVTGPAIFLVIYIFAVNDYHLHGLTIQTSASLAYILATSQAISTVISLAVPVVITVHAYHLASDWLRASRDPTSDSRPSPLQ